MAGGYAVLDGDGGTVPGTGAADAARWLGGFGALQGRRDGYRLLYGSPDLAALVHDGQQSAIRATAAASRRVALTRNLPLLILPTGGRADEATAAAATDLKPKAIVLSDRSAAGPGPAAHRTRRGPDRQRQLRGLRRRPRSRPAGHRRTPAAAAAGRDLDRGDQRRRRHRPRPGPADHHREPGHPRVRRGRRPLAHLQPAEHAAAVAPGRLVGGVPLSRRRTRRRADREPAEQPAPLQRHPAHLHRPAGRRRPGRGRPAAPRWPGRPAGPGGGRTGPGRPSSPRSRRPSTRWCTRGGGDPQPAPGQHHRPAGRGVPDHGAQHAARRARPRRQRHPGPAGLHLRQRPAADHQADRVCRGSEPSRASPSTPR